MANPRETSQAVAWSSWQKLLKTSVSKAITLNGIRTDYTKIRIKRLLSEQSLWCLFLQEVIRRILIAETRIQSRGTCCRICGGRSASQRNSISLCQLPFHHSFTLIHILRGMRNPLVVHTDTGLLQHDNKRLLPSYNSVQCKADTLWGQRTSRE